MQDNKAIVNKIVKYYTALSRKERATGVTNNKSGKGKYTLKFKIDQFIFKQSS